MDELFSVSFIGEIQRLLILSSVTIFEKTRKEKLRVEELCEETKQATVIRITFAFPDAFEPVPESSPKLSIY